jgi:aspartate/methionine/tyrosine aminotransferase
MPVHLDLEGDVEAQLDAAYSQRPFAALIVTNPSNPTGEVIAPSVLRSYFDWCCRTGVHLVRYDLNGLQKYSSTPPYYDGS